MNKSDKEDILNNGAEVIAWARTEFKDYASFRKKTGQEDLLPVQAGATSAKVTEKQGKGGYCLAFTTRHETENLSSSVEETGTVLCPAFSQDTRYGQLRNLGGVTQMGFTVPAML